MPLRTYYDIFLFLGYAALLVSGSLLQTFLHCVKRGSCFNYWERIRFCEGCRYMGIRSVQNADCALQIEGKIQTAES